MDEKITPELNKEITAANDPGAGVQSETEDKIKQLNAETERLIRAIAEHENAKARAALGGVSVLSQPEVKKALTPKEYKDEIMAGRIPKL